MDIWTDGWVYGGYMVGIWMDEGIYRWIQGWLAACGWADGRVSGLVTDRWWVTWFVGVRYPGTYTQCIHGAQGFRATGSGYNRRGTEQRHSRAVNLGIEREHSVFF